MVLYNSDEFKDLVNKIKSLNFYFESSSLHVLEERYEIDGERYVFYTAIGDTEPFLIKKI